MKYFIIKRKITFRNNKEKYLDSGLLKRFYAPGLWICNVKLVDSGKVLVGSPGEGFFYNTLIYMKFFWFFGAAS